MPRAPSPAPEDLALLDPDGSFRQRLEADRKAIAELRDNNDLEALRQVVHRLAGAAGTFGFTEIGDIAIQIDDRFVENRPVEAAEIARLLAALEQAFGKPAKSA